MLRTVAAAQEYPDRINLRPRFSKHTIIKIIAPLNRHYAQLGLNNAADREAVKNAFRRLAMIYHPDRSAQNSIAQQASNPLRFQEICQAYQRLLNHLDSLPPGEPPGEPMATSTSGALAENRNRRYGQRGSRRNRRFESVLESDYKGSQIKTYA